MRQPIVVESSTDKKRLSVSDLLKLTTFPTSYPVSMNLWAKALGVTDGWYEQLYKELKDETKD